MWSATRISADAASKMQTNAGILLNTFDVENPIEPNDTAIVCETTGDFSITCVPETVDFFEDVNNAPTNTKEGKRITGWTCGLSITALSITEETLKLSLGASEVGADGGVHPRTQYEIEDFKSLYWIGDMIEDDKLFVVAMDNTVSTGGLSFTASNDAKGSLGLELTPHATIEDMDKVPMAFYILTKIENQNVENQNVE